jgi:hypothetical protein
MKALLSAFAAFVTGDSESDEEEEHEQDKEVEDNESTPGILRYDMDFKRIGGGLLGCHNCLLSNFLDFTTLLCSILSCIAILLVNCLIISRITTRSIIVLFLIALGLPWWGVDSIYSTISLIKFHLLYQPPRPLKFKNIECALCRNTLRLQCNKFKNRKSRHQLQCSPRPRLHIPVFRNLFFGPKKPFLPGSLRISFFPVFSGGIFSQ